jgi:hypothetical protein
MSTGSSGSGNAYSPKCLEGGFSDTRHFALKAAEEATAALKERNDLETSVLVGQVRSTAMDLLRASGMDPNDSLHALRVAARHASEEQPTER